MFLYLITLSLHTHHLMTLHKVKLCEEFTTAKAIGMQQGFVG